jgi:hypothetical protein
MVNQNKMALQQRTTFESFSLIVVGNSKNKILKKNIRFDRFMKLILQKFHKKFYREIIKYEIFFNVFLDFTVARLDLTKILHPEKSRVSLLLILMFPYLNLKFVLLERYLLCFIYRLT